MFASKISRNIRKVVLNLPKLYSTKSENGLTYPQRIFSGIQPTGQVHLGNYMGAIDQWIQMQDNSDMLISIVDMHSMTLPHDPKVLRNNIVEMAATLLACGVNPDKTILFQQSSVPAHTHLSWCLGCISTMARLAHLPTFKEKSQNLKDVPLGLYVYPVLQTADILVYKATHVPVGEDQAQNIQLAQDLARMFNSRFGETFPIPHCIYTSNEFARLRSLRDPAKKMSKSDPDPKSRVGLSDPIDDIVKKIKKAVTDFKSEVTFDPENRPGVSNLISIHSFVTHKSPAEICEEVKHLNSGQYKLIVAEAVVEHIRPIQEKLKYLTNNQDYLFEVLIKGSEKANELSEKTIDEVKHKLGLDIGASRKHIAKKIKI